MPESALPHPVDAPFRGADLRGASFRPGELPPQRPLDFSGADLRGASFSHLDLAGSSFAGADLSGASFHNITLSRCDFSRCSARGAVFTDANLAYAQFPESDLRGALVFDANLTDVSFKGASLAGCEVDAVRFSLNGSTHVLGLKEAVCALAGECSYPYIMGVSGEAFWLSYFLKMRELNWGGFAKEALRRGLENFGFRCAFRDEVEEDAAWDALTSALADGATVITPLHVSDPTILGGGFGGSDWVFVSGIDRGDVLVSSLLGDRMRFSPERFRAGWCMHHPLEEDADDLPIVYAMCVVEGRERTPSRAEVTREGLRAGVEILCLGSTEKVAFGFDAYMALVQDLQEHRAPEDMTADELRRFLPWTGLGMLHHHGSRWAIRDFLDEILERGDVRGSDAEAIGEARDLYADVCVHLEHVLEKLPWSFDAQDAAARDEAIARYHAHREEAADLLRNAAAAERDALERFRAVVEPG